MVGKSAIGKTDSKKKQGESNANTTKSGATSSADTERIARNNSQGLRNHVPDGPSEIKNLRGDQGLKILDTKGITVKKGEDFSEWYTQVVQKAELADYAPVRGFMVIRPNAYTIWEHIQEYFNEVLKKKGVRNAYFPLLIPESFFKKEAKHAAGFNPELAYLAGKEEGERLAIRPTSETIMYDSYSKWIRSHRDLPLLINQWCNVLRWEVKQTKPFLRTREFLWQEGHCVFADEAGAIANQEEMAAAYRALMEELLAIPVLMGRKSRMETFAGAKSTITAEALMPDGKALQMGTSHNLGQNFAKSFNVKFKTEAEKEEYAWQTSWGFSTRLIGALILLHGDDKGLILPPRVAHTKGVIVPILFEATQEKVMQKARALEKQLAAHGVFVDDRAYSPGWKYNEWELKGVPLRIEIGPKDIEKGVVTFVRRDTGAKEQVPEKDAAKRFTALLEEIQNNLFARAKKFLDGNIIEATSMSALQNGLAAGKIVKAYMVDEAVVEGKIKEATGGATSRFVEDTEKEGICIQSGKKTKTLAYIAKAY